ncbi:dihydropteroate synthase [Halonotius pteroides]|uniref:Dihydropteroate synthase n=1 Tax=Halonotius pteroides TaxID=268735 RepID=A0A3A6QRC0_9EURY|nr:dihydropteroate synthase [Halonotius pteroides]RJX50817.1 dihydropteroate synthase [Halonotius pteroides]
MRTVDAAGLEIGDDQPPRIMGVLNVSSESPYKPSVFNSPGEAAEYVDRELIDEGADIVDIGLESANKKFEVLSAEGELDRLETALETIESVSGDAIFSIETRYHEVAEAALNGGFDMVNDICGFADPKLPEICADYDVAVGKMASPPNLEAPGAIEDVDDIYDALELNGLTDKTIIDPAFGGWSEDKTVEDDRETFRRLREFRGYGHPILVSINRKNFLRSVAGRDTEGALPVSLAATAMAVERGAHVIRTHDVAETRDAALIGKEFSRDRLRERDGEARIEELDITTRREAERHLEGRAGDTDIADHSVTRTFEIAGLATTAREQLLSAAAEVAGVVVSDTSDNGLVLIVTPAGVKTLTRQITAETPAVASIVERISERCC